MKSTNCLLGQLQNASHLSANSPHSKSHTMWAICMQCNLFEMVQTNCMLHVQCMPKCLGRGRETGWAGRTVLEAIHISKGEWIVAHGKLHWHPLSSSHLLMADMCYPYH